MITEFWVKNNFGDKCSPVTVNRQRAEKWLALAMKSPSNDGEVFCLVNRKISLD